MADLELSSNSKDSTPEFFSVVDSCQQEDLKEMKLHQQIANDASLRERNADKEAVPQKMNKTPCQLLRYCSLKIVSHTEYSVFVLVVYEL